MFYRCHKRATLNRKADLGGGKIRPVPGLSDPARIERRRSRISFPFGRSRKKSVVSKTASCGVYSVIRACIRYIFLFSGQHAIPIVNYFTFCLTPATSESQRRCWSYRICQRPLNARGRPRRQRPDRRRALPLLPLTVSHGSAKIGSRSGSAFSFLALPQPGSTARISWAGPSQHRCGLTRKRRWEPHRRHTAASAV